MHAVADRDPKAEDARGQGLYQDGVPVPVPPGAAIVWCSSLRLDAPEGGFERIADRCTETDARKAHMRLAHRIGERVAKTAGAFVDARVDAVLAQKLHDDFRVEVVGCRSPAMF